MSRSRILVVGGSDPSGGAGVDVDRATVESLGAEAAVVVTARTDQDDREVRALGAREPGAWLEEALSACDAAVTADGEALGEIGALKFGLLPGADHVSAATELVRRLRERAPDLPVVLDPVLESSSGFTFLDAAARTRVLNDLLPLAVVATPNLPEAAALAGTTPEALAAPEPRIAAAAELLARGARGIVLKGGHADEDPVRDLLLEPASPPRWLEHERLPGPGIRGSGCRHASALATHLATGQPLPEAAHRAALHVAACIRAAP